MKYAILLITILTYCSVSAQKLEWRQVVTAYDTVDYVPGSNLPTLVLIEGTGCDSLRLPLTPYYITSPFPYSHALTIINHSEKDVKIIPPIVVSYDLVANILPRKSDTIYPSSPYFSKNTIFIFWDGAEWHLAQ